MVNKIVADSFETLGRAVKQVGDDIAENIGLKPQSDTGTSEQSSQQQQAQTNKIKKMDEAGKKKAVARYHQIQEEIRQMQGKRSQEMVKYSQPGFTDEEKQKNQIKQLEEKPSFAKATDGKNELPPLPVRRASQKTEKLRGVSG